MVDLKKVFLMITVISLLATAVGYLITKLPAVSGLLAGGAIAGALSSMGGGGGLGGMFGGRNKKDSTPAERKKRNGGKRPSRKPPVSRRSKWRFWKLKRH